MSTAAANVLQTIGNTPSAFLSQNEDRASMLVKFESSNPGGSLKDRSALQLVNWGENTGRLVPKGTIIESSSGNFAVALAMIGAIRGYRVIAIVDPKITVTNRRLLDACGAEIIIVNEKDDSGSYHKTRIAHANKLANDLPHSFRPDQCFNTLNGDAHYRGTARELHEQVGDRLAAVVCSVSTGGQIGGISRYFSERSSEVEVIGVDVEGSSIFGGEPHSYLTPGVGLSWTPDNITDIDHISKIFLVSDEDSYRGARVLARNEGVLAGPSTGAAYMVAAATANALGPEKVVAFLASDRGERYLHTAFDDVWLASHGITTDTSMGPFLMRAQSLEPVSFTPNTSRANYRPELAEMLQSPTPIELRREK